MHLDLHPLTPKVLVVLNHFGYATGPGSSLLSVSYLSGFIIRPGSNLIAPDVGFVVSLMAIEAH
jgi:hypothetical protein